ncbi:hypothetical protein Pmani_034824, partial [Petrolisthes manimaculis]
MGIRHSKKSHDIQSSPKKNGSTAETEVKIKELPEDGAPVKVVEDKPAGETIEEVAEKTTTTTTTEAAPNGEANADQTKVERKSPWEGLGQPGQEGDQQVLDRPGTVYGRNWLITTPQNRTGRTDEGWTLPDRI